MAASVQAVVPEAMVAAAFHHVPAHELGDLDHPIESDVLICSDHEQATAMAAELVNAIPNMRPLDAGELSQSTPIESFTSVLLQLNVRYKTRVAIKFTGIPDGTENLPKKPKRAAVASASHDGQAATAAGDAPAEQVATTSEDAAT